MPQDFHQPSPWCRSRSGSSALRYVHPPRPIHPTHTPGYGCPNLTFQPQIPAVSTSFPHTTVIHRDLANPQGIYPCLNWDIAQLPSSSWRIEDGCTNCLPSFDDGALDPGCNNVQINFNHPTFNPVLGSFGPIMVYPLGNATEITVENVMDAVYVYFQQPLTCHEWNRISIFEQQLILESCHSRISQTHHLPGYERSRGPLRVDMLNRCTRFAGLQIMSSLNRSALLYMNLAGWH